METPVLDSSRHALEIDDTIHDALHGPFEKNSSINYVKSRFLTPHAWDWEWCYLFMTLLVIRQNWRQEQGELPMFSWCIRSSPIYFVSVLYFTKLKDEKNDKRRRRREKRPRRRSFLFNKFQTICSRVLKLV